MIDTKLLKQKMIRMDDCAAKRLILSLPDEISKEDLFSKFDFILQLLDNKKEARS